MKKFTLLPIGETFEFNGEVYVKTGPLTACNQATNSQRMIPRSALVKTAGGTPSPATTEKPPRQLPEDRVIQAFEQYHKGCMEWLLLTEERDSELASRIREAMELAHQRFLDGLKSL